MRPYPRDLLTELGHADRILWVGRGVFEAGSDEDVVDVDSDLARRVVMGLAVLDSQKSAPLVLIVDSAGGFELDGIAIHDAIARCRSHVTALVMGQACSMSAVFIQAADLRLISRNSWLMIHVGNYGIYEERPGEAEAILAFNKAIKKQTTIMMNARAQIPARKLAKLMKTDCWLTAQQSVELGLVDKIFDGDWSQLLNPTV